MNEHTGSVLGERQHATRQMYDWRDCALYALAVGMGSDPLDEDELAFVYEGRMQKILPSLCVTLAWLPAWHDDPALGIAWPHVLHGEQRIELHRPLDLQGEVAASHELLAVEDKGPGRGAILHVRSILRDESNASVIATLHATHFLRRDGGSGCYGDPPSPLADLPSDARPDASVTFGTLPQAALLYRLASRDLVALHADPAVARAAGFRRPIAHGLATLGLACRVVVGHALMWQPERLRTFAARFASPALPGDTIRVDLFVAGSGALRFRATAVERNVVVLDRGECRFDTAATW